MATDFTKQQLNTILSALDGKQRNPANKSAARKAVEKSALALGLSQDDVLQAADGLIDGRLSPADFLAELQDQDGPKAASKPKTRTRTKQAKMIDLMKRPQGATVEQIAKATGWQHHTVRGAISGALKKKLGLKVETTKEHGGTVYRIAI
jgi:DNA-binding NarL/FixJ family response regulator